MKRKALYISLYTVIYSLFCVMIFFVLSALPYAIVRDNLVVFTTLVIALLLGILITAILFLIRDMSGLNRLMATITIALSFFLLLALLLCVSGFFEVVSSVESLQTYIENLGSIAWLVYFIMQFLQVVVLPLPGTVTTVVGVMLFGSLKTFILSTVGMFLGALVCFIIGRKFGYKVAVWIVGEDSLNKWQQKLKGKDSFVLSIMFIFPFFPDDVLCFVAGLSSMRTRTFCIVTLISRLLSNAFMCFSISTIPFDTWWGLLLWGIIGVLFIATFIIVLKKFDAITTWLKKLRNRNDAQ